MSSYKSKQFNQIYSNQNIMKKTTFTRKIGTNKGIARIWLEGKILSENGWSHRDGFNVKFSPEHKYIQYTKSPEGLRKVAGKVGREIIDTNSKKITECFGDAVKVNIEHRTGGNGMESSIRITAA
jgi:hypothetical protein